MSSWNADALVRNEPAGRTTVDDNPALSSAEAASVADEGVRVPSVCDYLGLPSLHSLIIGFIISRLRRQLLSPTHPTALYPPHPARPSSGPGRRRFWGRR